MEKLSFVIPVFNNQLSLEALYKGLVTEVATDGTLSYEFIFVDDGSSDNSLQIIKNLRKTDDNVRFVSLSGNFGQVVAITAGLKKVTGDGCLIRSADLQDPIDLTQTLIQEWKNGNRIVIGHRQQRSDNLTDRILSKIFYRLIQSVSPNMPKGGFDHCLLDRKIVNELNRFQHRNRFLQGDILSLGYNALFIPYERVSDPNSKQRIKRSLASRIKYSIDGILDSTYLPIRFMSALGVFSMISGVVYSAIIIAAWLTGNVPFDGWAPLMILILLIGGLIMLMLGVIGEYVWRIHDQLKKRPEFVVEEESE